MPQVVLDEDVAIALADATAGLTTTEDPSLSECVHDRITSDIFALVDFTLLFESIDLLEIAIELIRLKALDHHELVGALLTMAE